MNGRVLGRVVLSIAFAVILAGCSGQQPSDTTETDTSTETPTVSDLSTLPPSSFQAELDAHLAQATAAAAAWRPDAVITYVSVELPSSLSPNSGNEVYVFGSAGDLENWWTYSLSQDTGKFVRAIIPKEDFLGSDLDPINLEFWTMNYVQALQLAELNGGLNFRTTNPGTTVTTFLSHRTPRNWLWWTIEYRSPAGELLTLLVNPFQGEVVDESGTELSPPSSSGTSPTITPTVIPTITPTLPLSS